MTNYLYSWQTKALKKAIERQIESLNSEGLPNGIRIVGVAVANIESVEGAMYFRLDGFEGIALADVLMDINGDAGYELSMTKL